MAFLILIEANGSNISRFRVNVAHPLGLYVWDRRAHHSTRWDSPGIIVKRSHSFIFDEDDELRYTSVSIVHPFVEAYDCWTVKYELDVICCHCMTDRHSKPNMWRFVWEHISFVVYTRGFMPKSNHYSLPQCVFKNILIPLMQHRKCLNQKLWVFKISIVLFIGEDTTPLSADTYGVRISVNINVVGSSVVGVLMVVQEL